MSNLYDYLMTVRADEVESSELRDNALLLLVELEEGIRTDNTAFREENERLEKIAEDRAMCIEKRGEETRQRDIEQGKLDRLRNKKEESLESENTELKKKYYQEKRRADQGWDQLDDAHNLIDKQAGQFEKAEAKIERLEALVTEYYALPVQYRYSSRSFQNDFWAILDTPAPATCTWTWDDGEARIEKTIKLARRTTERH